MRSVITPEIASNLHLVGDRWTLLILRDLFAGRSRFEALQTFTGAGRATLTRRLNSLIEAQVIEKAPYGKGRFEYRLMEKGRALYPAALCAWQWERQFAPPQAALPAGLVHEACGAPLTPCVVCRHCQETLKRSDLALDPGTTFQSQVLQMKTVNNQRRRRVTGMGEDAGLTHIAEIVGDRWTILILVAMYFGVAKFDELNQLLGIATNILGERLNLLHASGVVFKEPYQTNPIRYRYLPSERGEALFGFVMVVWQWARDWAEGGENALMHRCGKPLEVAVICGNCASILDQ